MIADFRAVDFRMIMDDALLFYGADMPHLEQQRTAYGRALPQGNAHAQSLRDAPDSPATVLAGAVTDAFTDILDLLQPGVASVQRWKDYLRSQILQALSVRSPVHCSVGQGAHAHTCPAWNGVGRTRAARRPFRRWWRTFGTSPRWSCSACPLSSASSCATSPRAAPPALVRCHEQRVCPRSSPIALTASDARVHQFDVHSARLLPADAAVCGRGGPQPAQRALF